VLDNILVACLLRSGQKVAGDALRMCLETVMELGILAGELSRGRIEEHQAKSTLEELYSAFKRRVSRLVRILEILKDKELEQEGAGSINHLFVKLDPSWWAR